jgi:hypothetical protein
VAPLGFLALPAKVAEFHSHLKSPASRVDNFLLDGTQRLPEGRPYRSAFQALSPEGGVTAFGAASPRTEVRGFTVPLAL